VTDPPSRRRGGESGLQHERTTLAWDRTGVAFLVAGGLLLRVLDPPYLALRHVPGILGLAFGAALLAGAARPRGQWRHVRLGLVRVTAAAALLVSLSAALAIAARW
jgi:uncharacterized membrane protein YidH (DUF202 family)